MNQNNRSCRHDDMWARDLAYAFSVRPPPIEPSIIETETKLAKCTPPPAPGSLILMQARVVPFDFFPRSDGGSLEPLAFRCALVHLSVLGCAPLKANE